MSNKLIYVPTIQAPRTWATGGTYPGGADPWAGQPLRVNPAVNAWVPGMHPAADEDNYLHGERGDRLGESRDDLRNVAMSAEASAWKSVQRSAGTDLGGVGVTPSGVAVVGAFLGGENFCALGPQTLYHSLGTTPATPGNLTPACVVASGEKFLCGDSPDSFITSPAVPVVADITIANTLVLDAIPSGTGWLAIVSDNLTNAANQANVRGPRQFPAKPTAGLQIRKISAAGVVGGDTSSSDIQDAQTLFTLNSEFRCGLVRCGAESAQTVVFFSSGYTGRKFEFSVSTDEGDTWTDRVGLLPVGPPSGDDTLSVAWAPLAGASGLLMITMTNGTRTDVYTSPDLGVTWDIRQTTTRNAAQYGRGAFSCYDLCTSGNGVVLAIGFSITDHLLAAAHRPVFACAGTGESWSLVGLIAVPGGAGFPTFTGIGTGCVMLGGAGNGLYVPDAPLFSFSGFQL
jgi:hypothetical protein